MKGVDNKAVIGCLLQDNPRYASTANAVAWRAISILIIHLPSALLKGKAKTRLNCGAHLKPVHLETFLMDFVVTSRRGENAF